MSTIKCSKCSSTNIITGKQGFGFGKAAIGGILVGPIGLLAGGINSKRIKMQCMDCLHEWDHKQAIQKQKDKEALDRVRQQEKDLWIEIKKMWMFKG